MIGARFGKYFFFITLGSPLCFIGFYDMLVNMKVIEFLTECFWRAVRLSFRIVDNTEKTRKIYLYGSLCNKCDSCPAVEFMTQPFKKETGGNWVRAKCCNCKETTDIPEVSDGISAMSGWSYLDSGERDLLGRDV